MKIGPNCQRTIWLLAGIAGVVLGSASWPRPGLGQVESDPAPSSADLLKVQPFDRLTLVDGTTVNIDPVSPRPLPPYDTKKERARRRAKEEKDRPPEEGNILLPAQQAKKKSAQKEEEEVPSEITVHLQQGEARDFRVKRIDIKQLDYFEDMLMTEADRLARRREFAKAFEHLMAVHQRDPKWPKLDEHVNDLLYREGSAALLDGDGDRGLRLLGELHARKSDYPELVNKLAEAYGARLNKAFDVGAFQRARQIYHILDQIGPQHPLTRVSKDKFLARAKALFEQAAKQKGGDRLDSLVETLRVWPEYPGAAEAYHEAFSAFPTLSVAVADLPRPVAPWVRSPASDRVARLVYLPILANESEAAVQGTLAGQLCAGLDKTNIGRRLELKIKPGIVWSDGSRPVSAIDLVRSLGDRADPRCPGFNARWADLLDKIVAPDEEHIEIHVTRTFLKPEAWLLNTIGPAHAAWDGWVTTSQGRLPVGDGPFVWQGSRGDVDVYTAREGQSAGISTKLKRIREVRYPSTALAVAAFLRGDVAMIEHVPTDRVASLSQASDIKVGRYEQPVLHRIAIDGRNPALRNRTLRRGLAYAIDRKTLLEETILKHPADEVNTLSDGIFAKGSYADAPGIKPLEYDPLLAKMLVAAARKEMGGGPIRLTFEYPATPEAQAAVPKIAEALRMMDLEIDTVERPESELEASLRAGKRFDLAYRASRCIEPVWEAGPLICPAYDAPPDANGLNAIASSRMLELLLRLERAPELPTATGLAVMIDRESRDELPVLPLWQLEDHYAWRSRVKGTAESTSHLYLGIESWEVEPWFARDGG